MSPKCSQSAPSTAAGRRWNVKTGVVVPVLMFAQLLASAIPAPTWAALGDTEASVTSDSQALKASPRVAARAAFTVHELQTPAGTLIREFVAPSGVVFAVTWRGPFKPSMPLLLGQSFAEYAHAPRAQSDVVARL